MNIWITIAIYLLMAEVIAYLHGRSYRMLAPDGQWKRYTLAPLVWGMWLVENHFFIFLFKGVLTKKGKLTTFYGNWVAQYVVWGIATIGPTIAYAIPADHPNKVIVIVLLISTAAFTASCFLFFLISSIEFRRWSHLGDLNGLFLLDIPEL